MSNKFLGFLTTAGKDVVHVVEEAPKAALAVEHLLVDGTAIAPEVKTQITNIFNAGQEFVLAAGGALASQGSNVILDGAAAAAGIAFCKVFLAGFPVIVKDFGTLVSDVKAEVSASTPPA